jgi:hypothetical protein
VVAFRVSKVLAFLVTSVLVISVMGVIGAYGVGPSGAVRSIGGATLTPESGPTCTVTVSSENLANDAIQTAINGASTGAVLCIGPGTYPEQLTINATTDLTLLGSGNTTTFLQPTSVGANGIDLDSGTSVDAVVGAWNDTNLNVTGVGIDGSAALASVEGNCGVNFYGVYLGNSSATLLADQVTGISSDGGCQGQNAVFANTGFFLTSLIVDQSVQILNSTVSGFGKNGITCNDVGLVCTVSGNTVTATPMALGFAATNGIQFWGATGSIRNNTVLGNVYTPGACLQQNYFNDGSACTSPNAAYWSGGILVLSPPTVVNVSGNHLSDNQVGLWSLGGPVSAWENDVSNAGYYGVVLDFNGTDVGGPSAVYAPTPFVDLVGDNTFANGNVGVLVFDDNATVEGNSATNVNVSYEFETTTGSSFTDSLLANTASANVSGALLGDVSSFQPGVPASLSGTFVASGNNFTNVSTGSTGGASDGLAVYGANVVANDNTLTGFSSGLSAIVGPAGNVAAEGNAVTAPAPAAPGSGLYVFAGNATIAGNDVSGYSWMNGPGWWPNSQATGLFVQCLEACTVSHNTLDTNAIGIGIVSYAYGPSPAPDWPFAASPSAGPVEVTDNTVTASGAFGIALELNQETSNQVATPSVSITGNTVNNTATGAVGLMVDQGTYTIGSNVFVGTTTSGSSGASQPTGEGAIGTAAIQVLDAYDSVTWAYLGGDQFVGTSVPLAVLNVTSAPPYFAAVVGNTVTFTETGLPSGTPWQVTVDGTPYASTTSTIQIDLAPGFHSYTVGPEAGYATPSGGSVSVGTSPVSVAVTFAPEYAVTFTESGLPGGTSWSVSLNSVSHASTSTAVGFSETDGTYGYQVGYVAGWHVAHETGTVTVAGHAVGVHLSFTATTYLVTFAETGLPASTSWSIAVDGGAPVSTTATTIVLHETNGTYTYTVGYVAGWKTIESGSFVLNGGHVTVWVHFTPKLYKVTFTEHHLPAGTSWSVSVNGGAPVHSTHAAITFSEANGSSYSFVLGDVPGWNSTTERGTFTVAGSTVAVSIDFTAVHYRVTIAETGLPVGKSWKATLNTAVQIGTFPDHYFLIGNGTWSFSVNSAGYTATPSSGTITVSGGPASQGVSFS